MNHPIYPEYELILSVKLKNALKKEFGDELNCLEINLKNFSVNWQKRGCCGFIRNKVNGNIAYVNTEPIYCGYLRRYARHMTDQMGEVNQFSRSLKELVHDLARMLAFYREEFHTGTAHSRVYKTGYYRADMANLYMS